MNFKCATISCHNFMDAAKPICVCMFDRTRTQTPLSIPTFFSLLLASSDFVSVSSAHCYWLVNLIIMLLIAFIHFSLSDWKRNTYTHAKDCAKTKIKRLPKMTWKQSSDESAINQLTKQSLRSKQGNITMNVNIFEMPHLIFVLFFFLLLLRSIHSYYIVWLWSNRFYNQ